MLLVARLCFFYIALFPSSGSRSSRIDKYIIFNNYDIADIVDHIKLYFFSNFLDLYGLRIECVCMLCRILMPDPFPSSLQEKLIRLEATPKG